MKRDPLKELEKNPKKYFRKYYGIRDIRQYARKIVDKSIETFENLSEEEIEKMDNMSDEELEKHIENNPTFNFEIDFD